MSKQYADINVQSDTFEILIERVNDLVELANSEIVTANSTSNGAFTYGNGYVYGTFGSNTMVVFNGLRGGNVASSANLTITSNAYFQNTVQANSGVILAGGYGLVTANTYASVNTSAQMVDRFAKASYRGAKYFIQATDTSTSEYLATEIMLLHNGTNTYTTEYATLVSGTLIAQFTSQVNGANVELLMTPATTSVSIKFEKTLLST